jgi:hydroxyethylthiazole kinase-like uncharacterized protein yjeF
MNALYQNLDWSLLSKAFLPRNRDAHKGDFGHICIIGGDYGMAGATRLCAEAALRVGAGLVSVATRPEHVAAVVSARPEIMCHGVKKSADLLPLLKKATVIVLGPGLGQSEWSHELFHAAVTVDCPAVIDADALTMLSQSPIKKDHWVLTPHPGEAARMLGCATKDVQSDRLSAVKKCAANYGGVVVLKGAGTLIAAEHETPFLCSDGNPGMATAGMGDVLSGVLGGLLAQHFSLLSAANTAVLLHAQAGDLAAREGGERGLIASDLMSHLRHLVNPTLQ